MRLKILISSLIVVAVAATDVAAQATRVEGTSLRVLASRYDLSSYRGGPGYGTGLELERVWGSRWVWTASVRMNIGFPGPMDDFGAGEWFNGQWVSVEEGLELIGPGVRIGGAYRLSKGDWWTAVGPEFGALLSLTESIGMKAKVRPLVALRWDLGFRGVSLLGRVGVFRFPVQWVRDDTVVRTFGDWRRIWELGLAVRL